MIRFLVREWYAWGLTHEKRPHVRRLRRRLYDAIRIGEDSRRLKHQLYHARLRRNDSRQ